MPNKFQISNFLARPAGGQFPINFQFFNLRIRKLVTNWRLETGDRKLVNGFTLIELLVVISIIGILATLVTANLNSARSRARDAQRKSDLRNIFTALRLYYNDAGVYPTSLPWGSEWIGSGTTVYMPVVPQDPLSPAQTYKYQVDVGSDVFVLSACLENSSDAQGVSAAGFGSWCPSSWMFQIKQ